MGDVMNSSDERERVPRSLATLAYQPFLFGLRLRNTEIDRLFYDVGALAKEERLQLAGLNAREGEVIVVPPAAAREPIQQYRSVRVFLDVCGAEALGAASGRPPVDAFVVAGVGRSALGCAALARNVADHLGRAVAGVVSDADVADLFTEAIGGWFSLGLADAFRERLARSGSSDHSYLELVETSVADAVVRTRGQPGSIAVGEARAGFVPRSLDARALLWLLCDRRAKVELLVGHGRGSVAVANALIGYSNIRGFAAGDPARDPMVVTLGTAVPVPPGITRVHQFVGDLDWYGSMRSKPGVACERVPHAWHHLNRALPYHLSVDAVLRRVDARRGRARDGREVSSPS
jgi:hypothetical protein